VFVLLALATVAAFFITQRLKTSDPVVDRLAIPLVISPNGDGRKDTAKFSFTLPKGDRVTVDVVNETDDVVRRVTDGKRLGKGRHSVVWDGKDDNGRPARDGVYYVRVSLLNQGRAATGPRGITVETTAPEPRLTSVRRLRNGLVQITYEGPSSPPPVYRVWKVDAAGEATDTGVKIVGDRGTNTATWDGFIGLDRAGPGHYAFSVAVQNKALVEGTAPRRLPPTRDQAAPGTGLSIVDLALAGPLEPITAGGLVRVQVAGPSRRFNWKLTRLGSLRQTRRGVGSGRQLSFRVPADSPQGVYTLAVSAAGKRASIPIAVRTDGNKPILVVLPTITWQGINSFDGDQSGFPETLDDSSRVAANRPFANGRLPVGFAAETAPLMKFLGRRDYELTTDLALARGRGPDLREHQGVLFAGPERWLTDRLDLALRRYVEGGGNVAFFGGDSFRRTVRVSDDLLRSPSRPARTNIFAERVSEQKIEPAPIEETKDELNLFAGTDGLIGDWSVLEQSDGLGRGTELLTAAGRDPKRPALVGYKLGDGIVVRVGVPGWVGTLDQDGEEATVTRRIWRLLSR
jgi:hypothetical protein